MKFSHLSLLLCGTLLFRPSPAEKLVIGVGLTPEGYKTDMEVFDLANPDSVCENFLEFPREVLAPFVGLYSEGREVLVCGGHDASTFFAECFKYQEGVWNEAATLSAPRAYTAAVQIQLNGDDDLETVVVGGATGSNFLDTTEVYQSDTWTVTFPPLPDTIFQHCAVALDESTFVVIGGIQGKKYSSNVYIFQNDIQEWLPGPPLNIPRSRHSCARILRDGQSSEFAILVAGGYDGNYLKSTEIWSLGESSWRLGPELPHGLCCMGKAEEENGGVVIAGGYSDLEEHVNTLYYLPHSGDGAQWVEMSQKLKTARNYPAIFFIPDDMATCS